MPDAAAFNNHKVKFFCEVLSGLNFLSSYLIETSSLKISIHSFAPFVSLCYLFNSATTATTPTKGQRFLIKIMQIFQLYSWIFCIFQVYSSISGLCLKLRLKFCIKLNSGSILQISDKVVERGDSKNSFWRRKTISKANWKRSQTYWCLTYRCLAYGCLTVSHHVLRKLKSVQQRRPIAERWARYKI